MKKIFLSALLALSVSIPASAGAATVQFAAVDPELAALAEQLKALQAELDLLKNEKAERSDRLPNLSVSSTRLKKAEIDGGAETIEDQRLTILVKNNKYGAAEIDHEATFPFTVELYEVVRKSERKLDHAFSGYAIIPSADVKSEFRVDIDSARYAGEDDRTFRAKVTLDPARAIAESNERDNVRWSDTWTILGD